MWLWLPSWDFWAAKFSGICFAILWKSLTGEVLSLPFSPVSSSAWWASFKQLCVDFCQEITIEMVALSFHLLEVTLVFAYLSLPSISCLCQVLAVLSLAVRELSGSSVIVVFGLLWPQSHLFCHLFHYCWLQKFICYRQWSLCDGWHDMLYRAAAYAFF